jgi:PAS domain S-box-containing protein
MNAKGIATPSNVERELHDPCALLNFQQTLAEAANQAGAIEDVLQAVVRLICDYTGWPVGHVQMAHDGSLVPTNIWHLESPRLYKSFVDAAKAKEDSSFDDFSGRVLKDGKPVWIENLTREADSHRSRAAQEVEFQSGGAFPVCFGNDVVAVLEFYSSSPGGPDQQLLQVLHYAGMQLGSIIEGHRSKQALHTLQAAGQNLPAVAGVQLAANEALFHQMGEVIGQIFWLADPLVTHVTYASPAYETIWGRKRESLYQSPQSWWDAVHPEDRERVISSLPQPLTEKYSVEYRILRPDGSVRWIWDRRFPVRDQSGAIYQVAGVTKDVTNRKLAQAALRESEEKYRLLIEQSGDGIYLADHNGKLIFCNSRGREMLGYSAEEIAGLNIRDTYPPDEVHTAEQRLHDLRPGQTMQFERKMRRKDGTCFPVEVSLHAVKEGWFQGVVRDITERKRAEEELDRDRTLLRTLIETIPDRIYVKDTEARFILNNIAHVRALGAASQEEVKGKSDFDFRPADIAAERMADDRQVLESGQPLYNREEATIRADGKEGWNLVNKVPLRDAQGKIIGLVGISRDITERKCAEEEMDRDRTLLRTLIETIPDRIYAKDIEARFILNNIAHLRALGAKSQEETVGKTDFDFRPADVASKCMADDQQVLQSKETLHNREEQTKLADGRPGWILVNKVPLRDPEGKVVGLVGISRDITGLKEADEKLRTYAARLERSNRDLQDFAYVASHDLQEPLRKVQAFGDRLKAKYNDVLDDTGRDYLKRMFDAAGRMQTLINDLLSYSRVTTKAQPFAAVDLDKILREVLSDLEVRIEQTHGRMEVSPLGTIDADALQMRQLFQNLIGNALKFHKEGESPVIRIQGRPPNDASLPRLEITIADNGIGFDQKYADRIFVIFQRLHGRSQYEGTGVGLAVCKKIVERHGGVITAESKPGEGATFTILLPVKHSEGEQTT